MATTLEGEVGAPLPDIDTAGVMQCIPHRFPMLMIDRVVELRAYKSATGLKQVSVNEPYFQGHFPTDPIMPGVLLIEAMAQTAAVLVIASLGEKAGGSRVYFMGVENARFRRPVRPGDALRLEVAVKGGKLGIWKFEGKVLAGGDLVAEATFIAKMMGR